jgi:hypothetical protein
MAFFSVVGLVFALSVGIGVYVGGGPAALLGEWGPVTFLSTAQLVTCAALLAATFWGRRHSGAGTLWAVMAVGFLFLAADELFEFHERFDRSIHQVFSLRETPLSDRIDDGIVFLYALIGLFALHRGRRELALFRGAWPTLRLAITLLFAMVVLDLLTNRWFAPRGIDPESTAIKTLAGWGTVAEEGLKLASGALLVVTFVLIAALAQSRGRREEAVVTSLPGCPAAPELRQGHLESQAT